MPDDLLTKTAAYVRAKLEGESSGHDWWHVYRVWKMAEHINKTEKADPLIIGLGALLHDIADHKFYHGDFSAGPKAARIWLETQGLDELRVAHVCKIIEHISFQASQGKRNMRTLEGMIVQDADRLDALGAIGIARAFAVGAKMGRPLYDPEHPEGPSTLLHFNEKLLLLKNLMNTATAKKIAVTRHARVLKFMRAFLQEWEGT